MQPLDARHTDPGLPRIGEVVAGKYRVEKIVGQGGMGVVYAAHHVQLDKRVALKVLILGTTPHDDEIIERFVREAQAAARLQSEHVVRVTDAGSLEHGAPFLVMEYLQGCDLEELMRLNGPLDPQDVADYVLQSLAALAQAHAAGIIHRDLKPANLFLAVRPDGSNIIKIVDFGISKQPTSHSRWKELTGETMLGTPGYMSPEQLRSSQGVDPRADIWSIGVVMYELLTGELPFDGDGPGAVFAAILENDPTPLRTHRPEIAAELEAVVLRCLRRKPEDRYADVGALAEALVVHGSGRWNGLVAGIAQTLARSAPGPDDDAALLAAVEAAAFTSRPPPPRGTTQKTLVTVIAPTKATIEVDVVFEQDRERVRATDARRRARRRWQWLAASGVLLLGTVLAVRHAYERPPPVAAAGPPLPEPLSEPTVVAMSVIELPPPVLDAGAAGSEGAHALGDSPGAPPVHHAKPPARPSFLRSRN